MFGRLFYGRHLLSTCRFQSTNALPTSQPLNGDRIRLVNGWKAPRSGTPLSIEVAREEDRPILHKFLNEQTRLQEPIISSTAAQVNEISNVFQGILDRSVGSGLTLMMFKEEGLIGIRMTSIAEMPKEPTVGESKLLPDYKELIDQQPGESRKDKQVSALCELMYGFGHLFLPADAGKYFCMELIGIKLEFRKSQRVCQKLGLRVKMEIEYGKFLDNGQICLKDTNDGSTSARLLIGDLKQMGYC